MATSENKGQNCFLIIIIKHGLHSGGQHYKEYMHMIMETVGLLLLNIENVRLTASNHVNFVQSRE